MLRKNKKDYAAMAEERDRKATAATGSQTAAQPAAPAGVPAPTDSDRAQTAEEAAFFKGWYDAVFYANPTGALKKFLDRVERGIESGHYTIEQAVRWMRDPENELAIQTLLSLSVPFQRVLDEDLDAFAPAAVIEKYMQELYISANGDLSRLRLGGDDAAPAPAPVRRASLLPIRRLVPHVAGRVLAGSDQAAGPSGLRCGERGQAAGACRRGSRCSWHASRAARPGRCEPREQHSLECLARG